MPVEPPLAPLTSSAGFEALYREHAESVLRYFIRRVVDPHLALDLTAETFAKALAGARGCRASTPEARAAWLFGIANREHLQWCRRGKVEWRGLRRLGVSTPTFSDDDLDRIDALVDLGQYRAEVAAAVRSLPADQRTAVSLRVVDDLPYRDVARRLDITEQTARARVSRGLAALRKRITLDPGATT